MLPYLRTNHPVQKIPITKIIIGPKIKDKNAMIGLKDFLNDNKYENVFVEYSRLSMR